MKYFKITCTNGYCGCNEDFYITAKNESDVWDEAEEILTNVYSFWDPDSRFVDEITKEEYEEYTRDYE